MSSNSSFWRWFFPSSSSTLGRYSTTDDVIAYAKKEGADLKGKVALVTGGNCGLGYETCRALASAGCTVILTSRSLAEGENARRRILTDLTPAPPSSSSPLNSTTPATTATDLSPQLPSIIPLALDLGDFESIEAFVGEVLARFPSGPHLMVLNAGLMAPPLGRTKQGFELQLGVNHIGHFYLIRLLLPSLLASRQPDTRIVVLSSLAHTFTSFLGFHESDLNYERRSYSPLGAYASSKLLNALFALHLASQLRNAHVQHVTVYAVHPGSIYTRINRHAPYLVKLLIERVISPLCLKTVKQGAATQVWAAVAPELSSVALSGAYLEDCSVSRSPIAKGRDPGLARRVWEWTEKAVAEKGGKHLEGIGVGGA